MYLGLKKAQGRRKTCNVFHNVKMKVNQKHSMGGYGMLYTSKCKTNSSEHRVLLYAIFFSSGMGTSEGERGTDNILLCSK